MTILLRCPKCNNKMKYMPLHLKQRSLKGKTKKCVYCGRRFTVEKNICVSNQ